MIITVLVFSLIASYAFMSGITYTLCRRWGLGEEETAFLAAIFWFVGLPAAFGSHLVKELNTRTHLRKVA